MNRILLTAGDTWPMTGTVTDNYIGVDITGWAIACEIDYETPLVVAATITVPLSGQFEFQWTDTDLVAGEWEAVLTITNEAGQVQTTERVLLVIAADITPPVVIP